MLLLQVGYKKEKLDPELYEYLMDWYGKPARRKTTETWPPDNTYVNHWKLDTVMMHAPTKLHRVSVAFFFELFVILVW